MIDAGGEQRLPPVTPADDLIAAVELDHEPYRRELQRLYEEYPLSQKRLDVSMADLEDLAAEAVMLPSMLRETDPLSFFEVGYFLDQALRMRDDGSASFILRAGSHLLQILEIPICTQIRLRNVMEMTFDGMERASQQERFEKLRGVYPDIAQFCDPARLKGHEDVPLVLPAGSVYELRLLELMLYFRQEKKRIARCEYCWNYFVPKTKAAVLYCDRTIDGQKCKRRGANLKRKQGPELDGALKLFRQLRDRMYARMLRYGDAPENQRQNLIQMTGIQFDEWEKNARQARRDYMAGKIPAGEFLRRIDTTHELSSYDTVKQELPDEESCWQRRVAGDPDFDPARAYLPLMSLELGEEDPQWEFFTPEDLMREDQKGHQSLRNRYGKGAGKNSDKAEEQ